jgi:ubiquinone/menaquinone biosynthesis C-methylase UbiE
MTHVDTTYEPYSQDPGYIEANTSLINSVDLSGVHRVADLACGTGLLSGLLIGRKPTLAIAGIDLDPIQIGIARRTFPGATVDSLEKLRAEAAAGRGAAFFNAGSAMELPFNDGEVDLVVMGNAIHLMPDRTLFLKEVSRVLRKGGQMVFNSVFYIGTFVPGTEPLWTEWMKQALEVLGEINAARAAKGEPQVPRVRGKGDRAFRKDWLSGDGWAQALADAGLNVTLSADRPVPISAEGLAMVGAYGGLAEVLMSGYPIDIASECLQVASARAFAAKGMTEVPRNWLEMRAIKA